MRVILREILHLFDVIFHVDPLILIGGIDNEKWRKFRVHFASANFSFYGNRSYHEINGKVLS